jgi:hypothetical protein
MWPVKAMLMGLQIEMRILLGIRLEATLVAAWQRNGLHFVHALGLIGEELIYLVEISR